MARWLSWLERRPVTAEVRGSNPLRVAQLHMFGLFLNGILAQLGEHLPYKQRVTGSSPVGPIFLSKCICVYADVAQLAEQLICNQQVNGSSPLIGSMRNMKIVALGELSSMRRFFLLSFGKSCYIESGGKAWKQYI